MLAMLAMWLVVWWFLEVGVNQAISNQEILMGRWTPLKLTNSKSKLYWEFRSGGIIDLGDVSPEHETFLSKLFSRACDWHLHLLIVF